MNKKQIFKQNHSQTQDEIIEKFKIHYNYYIENDDL